MNSSYNPMTHRRFQAERQIISLSMLPSIPSNSKAKAEHKHWARISFILRVLDESCLRVYLTTFLTTCRWLGYPKDALYFLGPVRRLLPVIIAVDYFSVKVASKGEYVACEASQNIAQQLRPFFVITRSIQEDLETKWTMASSAFCSLKPDTHLFRGQSSSN